MVCLDTIVYVRHAPEAVLKEKFGGTIAIITVDPKDANSILCRYMACSAEKATRLADHKISVSGAYAIAKIPHNDLVLSGMQTNDHENAFVGRRLRRGFERSLRSIRQYYSRFKFSKFIPYRVGCCA